MIDSDHSRINILLSTPGKNHREPPKVARLIPGGTRVGAIKKGGDVELLDEGSDDI